MSDENQYEEMIKKFRKNMTSSDNSDLDFLDQIPAAKPAVVPSPYGSSNPTPYGWFLNDKNV